MKRLSRKARRQKDNQRSSNEPNEVILLKKIAVLVVDDSALMRKTLKTLIESDPSLEVIDTARDGEDAVEKARRLHPDVITMDVNMPKMDGLTALQIIVEEQIAPVVVVSSLTQEGSVTAFEALELGAFDYVPKPGGTVSLNMSVVRDELVSKIKEAYKASTNSRVMRRLAKSKTIVSVDLARKTKKVLPAETDYYGVAIGISTGGPKTIYDVLPNLPENLNAAVFLVQHMPPNFTNQYAQRLDQYCALKVVEASDGMEITPGVVYVGKGGYHLKVRKGDKGLKIWLSKIPKHMFMPSADVMMESVLEHFGSKTVGVLMTGMGDDGANAMVKIKLAGGYTIAESEETAIVFGMPAEAINRGGASVVLPSYEIAQQIIKKVGVR
ncbi:protein-glutamate methylesterase/protein-glutamine glutaminase [Pseudothermotoga sp. U03pept]|uniref:protein-glutamate methylesterase/protein-glutamine glutaminase n=1 Tax=Pseudothermotoga sp. U03pept TaxID=3447012 RepID=UPI003F0C9DC5